MSYTVLNGASAEVMRHTADEYHNKMDMANIDEVLVNIEEAAKNGYYDILIPKELSKRDVKTLKDLGYTVHLSWFGKCCKIYW